MPAVFDDIDVTDEKVILTYAVLDHSALPGDALHLEVRARIRHFELDGEPAFIIEWTSSSGDFSRLSFDVCESDDGENLPSDAYGDADSQSRARHDGAPQALDVPGTLNMSTLSLNDQLSENDLNGDARLQGEDESDTQYDQQVGTVEQGTNVGTPVGGNGAHDDGKTDEGSSLFVDFQCVVDNDGELSHELDPVIYNYLYDHYHGKLEGAKEVYVVRVPHVMEDYWSIRLFVKKKVNDALKMYLTSPPLWFLRTVSDHGSTCLIVVDARIDSHATPTHLQ
ncbi:uncharacterized protein B0H18DRAFT_1125780 [Fomitopsis serialis]|uniref:uncharacterized protein n=1 Tax=Fomitopsis serialis TaxID=139415 RepID=UPI0020078A05|nr:uncharacterized protein B0H18DRAFT_1125780 [Neoantrodia serialis]KAH9914205.1 hypothetical protein B0H18DRAFT_1125780 [Neoantrodia serialis]